jgi:hypothetical protein
MHGLPLMKLGNDAGENPVVAPTTICRASKTPSKFPPATKKKTDDYSVKSGLSFEGKVNMQKSKMVCETNAAVAAPLALAIDVVAL